MPTGSTVPTFARLLVVALFAGLAVGCASSKEAEKSSSESTPTETQSSAQKPSDDDPAAEGNSPGDRSAPSEQGSETPSSAEGDLPTAGDKERIPDAELEEFIRVSRQMRKIEMKARRKIQGAQSKEKKKEMQKKARAEMESVFQQSSLTKERYRAIGMRLQSDKKLRKRLKTLDRKSRPASPSDQPK